MKPPSKNPCGSCPYRKDAPQGLWDAEEYEKLPRYDQPTFDQPEGVFMCHQQDGRLCAGWVGCHDMEESLAMRLAASREDLTPEEYFEILDYTTATPLHPSGAAAAEHGLEGLLSPSEKTRKHMKKLIEKGLVR